MTIKIEIKTQYGVYRAFPACDTAKLLIQLTGRKTFLHSDLETLKKLGYQIEVKTPDLSLV